MIDGFVRGKFRANPNIKPRLVRHQPRLAGDVVANDFSNGCAVSNAGMERANTTASLDQRNHGALAGRTRLTAFGVRPTPALLGGLRVFLFAEIGLVGFDDLAATAHWGDRRKAPIAHTFANPKGHEPPRPLGYAKVRGSVQ